MLYLYYKDKECIDMEHIKIKVDQTKLPNKMHFEVQKNTRMNVFRDRTKYTRKVKHKAKESLE